VIKEEIINKVNPKTDKIKIKSMKHIKANSVVMEFDTRSDLQKFKNHPKFETTNKRTKKEKSSLDTI